VSGCEKNWNWLERQREVAEWAAGVHRYRFERRAEILPLPLCSHAVLGTEVAGMASIRRATAATDG